MSKTVDCGEGKHDLCTGRGRTAFLFPQESRSLDEPPFYCGCRCHHDGSGVPCEGCGTTATSGQGLVDAVVANGPDGAAL